jgi:hypothetical protein
MELSFSFAVLLPFAFMNKPKIKQLAERAGFKSDP